MMNAKIAACLVGLTLSVGAEVARAQSADRIKDAVGSPEVKALAEQLEPVDPTATSIQDRLVPLCSTEVPVGDVVEAALLAGHHIITTARDSMLACRPAPGSASDSAQRVMDRVLFLEGPTALRLANAGLLAAAAKLHDAPVGSPAAEPPAGDVTPGDFDETVRRMMEKTLCFSEACRRAIESSLRRIRGPSSRVGPVRPDEGTAQSDRDAKRDVFAGYMGKGTVRDAYREAPPAEPTEPQRKAERQLVESFMGKGSVPTAYRDYVPEPPVPAPRVYEPPPDPWIPPMLPPVNFPAPGGTASLQ